MSDFPDIISQQIISSNYDILWSTPAALTALAPRNVLVISTGFAPNSEEEEMLKKMLLACLLSDDDYHIVQMQPDEMLSWHALRDQLKVHTVLLLGIMPAQLGVSALLMPHQISRFNGCTWIVTDSLQTLIQRPEIKAHLWNYGLKPAFVEKVYGS